MQKKIAVLVADGFEQSEFEVPVKALMDASMILDVVSIDAGKVKGWKDGNWGMDVEVNRTVNDATAAEYDALLLPGGVMSPDKLRNNLQAIEFVKGFCDAHKPIAAICHGPWTLIETGYVKGKKMTSFSSIKSDLMNAGANWVDEEVMVDQGLVTSRSPKDLTAFCINMIETFMSATI